MGEVLKMKITDLAIIFVLITIPFIIVLNYKKTTIEKVFNNKIELNHIIDAAIEDGTSCLRSREGNVIDNRYKAVEECYNTIFSNLNIGEDKILQTEIMSYIPAILIIDNDGIFIVSNEIIKNDTKEKILKAVIKAKKPYYYKDDKYLYTFTLEDDYYIIQDEKNNMYEGNYKKLKTIDKLSSEIFDDKEKLEQLRTITITNSIQTELEKAVNNHNKIAQLLGIKYQFTMPIIEKEGLNRIIDDVGMLCFFQGMPIGTGTQKYNYYAFSGAINSKKMYYIKRDDEYYHSMKCSEIDIGKEELLIMRRKGDCAKEGYMPCWECLP